jgi:hypothetical protein
MGDLSTFYSLPQSLSSELYSFPCRGHSHPPLLGLHPGIGFFFEAIVNGIVFIYSFSVCSLLVYRNAKDFSMLNLYPATLSFLISDFINLDHIPSPFCHVGYVVNLFKKPSFSFTDCTVFHWFWFH